MWTSPPTCKSILYIKIISLSTSIAVTSILAFCIVAFFFRRNNIRKRRAQYFENQPLQKRNKENDAFVSFCGDDGPDHELVKTFLRPKLEEYANLPFKVTIHLRDFRADTLIYVNIRHAVTNSNSAIILMSQAYIDARWCREEFEVSNI